MQTKMSEKFIIKENHDLLVLKLISGIPISLKIDQPANLTSITLQYFTVGNIQHVSGE